jgi:hypothetical protein
MAESELYYLWGEEAYRIDLEKGKTVQKRCCPIGEDTPSCINCKPCSIMSGWGGAGAFSDGKLTLTTEFGGWLHNYMSKEKLQQLIAYVDQTYVDHGAPDRLFGQDNDKVQELMYRVARAGLRLIPAQIRHMGTENTLQVLSNMYKDLESRVTIKTGETVQGAWRSKGGKSFLTLYSTYIDKEGNRRPKIVPTLSPGIFTTVSRTDVQYVVTEYGVAYLKGQNLRTRVKELIRISHPDFRDWLESEARRLNYIP